MKRFIGYLLLTVSFIVFVFWGFKLPLLIKESMLYNAPLKQWLFFSTLFPLLIGIMLRLPKLINELKGKKSWSIDWIKLFAIGIPTLYVSQMLILYFQLPFGDMLPFGGILMRNSGMPLAAISGVVFGYVLLDSVKVKSF